MKKLIILITLVLLYGASSKVYRHFYPEMIPEGLYSTVASHDSSCVGKSKCVIFYLAPWCPACKGTLPFMKDFAQQLPEYDAGIQVVIGLADDKRVQDMAKSVPFPITHDADRTIAQGLDIGPIPAIFLTNAEGEILKREQFTRWNAPISVSTELFITKILKLKKVVAAE